MDPALLAELLEICDYYFTHIYIRNLVDDVPVDAHDALTTNKDSDAPGTYIIKKINNNIKNYSMKLTVTTNAYQEMEKTADPAPKKHNVHVDYKVVVLNKKFNAENFKMDVHAKIAKFFKPKRYENQSVVVLDLDDTLIDAEGEIIINDLMKFLNLLHRYFNFVILWSHGCQQHVNYIFNTTMKKYQLYFDDVIAKVSTSDLYNKGIGKLLSHLNTKFNVVELGRTLLIDDQLCNYNFDYDYFIHAPSKSEKHSERMWEMLNETVHQMAKSNKLN